MYTSWRIRAYRSPESKSLPPPRAGFLLNQCYNSFIGTCLMSEEQLKAFIEKVQGDTSLQEKLKAAADTNAVSAIAKEAGFMISADDLKKDQAIEISEEELEGVAGGVYPNYSHIHAELC